jgi:DNA repair protein SbcC/Rad50
MIPRYLVMEGLYSYRRRTEIDFTALTAARLFGIFGPVGSGKSTILEAIGLAVYGDTTRLNSRNDNRNYNLLNLRSNRLWIDFRFLNHDGREYRYTVETKRSGTDYEDVGSLQRKAYRRSDAAASPTSDDDQWVPLDSVAGEDVVGLSYENFRRTVIIPQGRFQEFLQLGVRDRTDMLQELFALDRFDLYRPTKNLAAATQSERTARAAALGEIPPDLDDRLQDVERELTDARTGRAEGVTHREAAEEWRSRLAAVAEVAKEKGEIDAEQERLNAEEEEISAVRRRRKTLETVRDVLVVPWNECVRLEKAVTDAEMRVSRLQAELEPAVAARKHAEERLKQLEEENARRPAMEQRRDALRRAMTYHQEVRGYHRGLQEVEGELRQLKIAREELAGLAEEEDALRRRIDEHERAIPGDDLIQAAEEYRRLQQQIALREKDGEKECLQLENLITHLQDNDVLGDPAPLTPVTDDAFDAAATLVRGHIDEFRRSGEVAAHLAELVSELRDGEPCPLCGATHHPALQAGPASDTTPPVSREEAAWMYQELAALMAARNERTGTVRQLKIELERVRSSVASGTDVPAVAAGLSEIRELKNALEADRRTLQTLQERRSGLSAGLTERTETSASLRGGLEEIKRRLTAEEEALPEELTTAEDPEVLEEEARRIDDTLAALDRELPGARSGRDEAAAGEARLLAARDERQETLDRLREEAEQARRTLDRAITGAAPADSDGSPPAAAITPATLPGLVEQLPDLPGMIDRISRHDQARRDVGSRLRLLEERTRQISLPDLDEPVETALARAVEAVTAADARLQHLDTRIGSLQREAEELNRMKTRRAELQGDVTRLDGRLENLNTLLSLFKGSKFVSYVASVFLEQLVAVANDRFRRLTRNRLELSLRGDHDFEVVDYLNGGRRRSVKTLSGGQTFQAALCLALALVDSIDHRAGQDTPGFFFLDEGFGSLDEDSLRDVFSTLTDLRRENRIVGVISHVESMQQEIDTYLRVKVDPEEGSMISGSG